MGWSRSTGIAPVDSTRVDRAILAILHALRRVSQDTRHRLGIMSVPGIGKEWEQILHLAGQRRSHAETPVHIRQAVAVLPLTKPGRQHAEPIRQGLLGQAPEFPDGANAVGGIVHMDGGFGIARRFPAEKGGSSCKTARPPT